MEQISNSFFYQCRLYFKSIFPYTTLEGSLEEVLTTPDKVAVNKDLLTDFSEIIPELEKSWK